MTDEVTTIFLADDHQILIDGMKALVAKDPELEVIGTCNDGLQVLARIEAVKPDVLVLDISLPGVHGLDLCRLAKSKFPDLAIMMLTMHSNRKCVIAALENGATGYLIKEAAAAEFCEAVRAVVRGEVYLGEGIPKSVLDEVDRKPADPADALIDQERQLLQLIVEGKSNYQIAEAMKTSPGTVDSDLANLMQRLDLRDHKELIKYAVRHNVAAVGQR